MAPPPTPEITLVLTPSQVRHVVRAASRSEAPGLRLLLAGGLGAAQHDLDAPRRGRRAAAHDRDAAVPAPPPPVHDDPRLSRSLLRGLALLARFGPGAPDRGVVELATELGMSPSTAHRYVVTLVEAGLLERVPRTRRYRLAGGAECRERT